MTKTLAAATQVPKMRTGIGGFDEITHGGLPRGRPTLVIGGPGCGKTVFALQTLVTGANAGEAGVFVAFEESARNIVANAASFGWNLPMHEKKRLFFLDARMSPDVVLSGDFDLTGMLNVVASKARELGAKRVVFDGIDVLLLLLDDPAKERRELYRIRDWLAETGLTAIITYKAGGQDHSQDFMQFMVDCVVILRLEIIDGAAFRNLRVIKYRGSTFSGDEYPISLAEDGLRMSHRGPNELVYRVSNERVSSGLDRLDQMLQGGYHRGSNVLVSGAPGTAKSTLCGLFTAAACKRGERAMYISFDEGSAQIVRNLRSVGTKLAPHLKSGLLKMYSTRTRGPNVEEQFAELRKLVRAHKPRCLVLDPLSALSTQPTHAASADATQQFLDFLKRLQITVVNSSLMDGTSTDEATASGVSTMADTWIHVSYVLKDGERNRALTIVKSRGTGHSNQVRELILSDRGVTLADVYVAHGKVLMGVARWEGEQDAIATRARSKAAAELKRLQLEVAQAEAMVRLQLVKSEMEARTAELDVLAHATGAETELVRRDRAVLRRMRHGDSERTQAPAGTVPAKRRKRAAR